MYAASVTLNVARRGLLVACRNLPVTLCLSSFLVLTILKTLNSETCVYRTKFGIVTMACELLNNRIPAFGKGCNYQGNISSI